MWPFTSTPATAVCPDCRMVHSPVDEPAARLTEYCTTHRPAHLEALARHSAVMRWAKEVPNFAKVAALYDAEMEKEREAMRAYRSEHGGDA